MAHGYETLLEYWLGELDADGLASPEHQARWWRSDPELDEELRTRFGALHAAVVAHEHDAWLSSPRGRLATVIVLDQLSRNLFRGTPGMYANDERALEVARRSHEAGDPDTLRLHERFFLVMPFMHAESLPEQERCLAEVKVLAERHEALARNVEFAIAHRDIVARFGRFPHRNDILGRESSDEERAFLKEPGSSF
ncbi:MAG: DUF924 domain-containing protein [Sandaracinus sp.]|nr:DUF924 domain-containing protein [Sandaracinus sp.]MCB9619283.1 DUF924 domain-containing protein [Sandaracinus sp.]MCB9631399.1 DUF924 domain-containing protein [Sandaracinus sp.]